MKAKFKKNREKSRRKKGGNHGGGLKKGTIIVPPAQQERVKLKWAQGKSMSEIGRDRKDGYSEGGKNRFSRTMPVISDIPGTNRF